MSEFPPIECSHQWLRVDTGPRSFVRCSLCGLEDSVKRLGFEGDLDSAVKVSAELADLREQVSELTRDLNQAHRMLDDERAHSACLDRELSRALERASRPAPCPAAPPKVTVRPAAPAYRWGLLLT